MFARRGGDLNSPGMEPGGGSNDDSFDILLRNQVFSLVVVVLDFQFPSDGPRPVKIGVGDANQPGLGNEACHVLRMTFPHFAHADDAHTDFTHRVHLIRVGRVTGWPLLLKFDLLLPH